MILGAVALAFIGYVYFSGDTEYNNAFRAFLRSLARAL
ncbi:hypothetical protein GLGR_3065 [Leminorella grimontii ATCC 33999 = DSM 5078]|nr:hypothetical protein GLGR_3065 [Leminorella grimontii ATCC 33999 = DSM 5078]